MTLSNFYIFFYLKLDDQFIVSLPLSQFIDEKLFNMYVEKAVGRDICQYLTDALEVFYVEYQPGFLYSVFTYKVVEMHERL